METIEVVKRILNQHLHTERGKPGAQLRYPTDGMAGDPGERLARDVTEALAATGHLNTLYYQPGSRR